MIEETHRDPAAPGTGQALHCLTQAPRHHGSASGSMMVDGVLRVCRDRVLMEQSRI